MRAAGARAQAAAPESGRIDRQVALAKLWAAVKFFHPYLAYRGDIDWDGALVAAIPKVNAARSGAEYSAVVEEMLETLGDPVTRVLAEPLQAGSASSTASEHQPTFQKNAAGVLVVSMTHYSELQDFVGVDAKLQALKKEIPGATGVLFDLRPDHSPSESEQGFAAYEISSSDLAAALTTVPIDLPGERRRMHQGYPPQEGTTSGAYASGFFFQGRPPIKSRPGAKDIPIVFLIKANSDLPDMALGFQSAGRGAIVAEGPVSEDPAVSTQTIELCDDVKVQIRLGELIYNDGTSGFAPNLSIQSSNLTGDKNPAFREALELATSGKFSPAPRARVIERASPQFDKTYEDMEYPPLAYRVLAAFRLWAVIDYFYPYKDLMGEDWNAVLRTFIPRMEQAKDALEYNLAVAEMATHIHDSHVGVNSTVMKKHFGDASIPVRVRIIEGLPVITAFTNPEAATAAGLEIGDVVLKVDGEDANRRIAERLKYTAHSTEQAGYFVAERSIIRGLKDSTAIITVRDLHDQVREVKVPRKTEYSAQTPGDRSGDILKILPGNIGYADLERLPQTRVDEMFDRFKDCPAIIFDDRGYPQGTAWSIAPRLTDKNAVPAAMFRRRDPMSPNLQNGDLTPIDEIYTFIQMLPHTDKPRYHGKTVLLIDERTISQAEHTGLFLEAANGTVFIGSPTMGANGDVTNLSAPGGLSISFSGEGVWHLDGRQLQRKGLQPTVEVFPTLAGIRSGKDEVLERAIEYLQQNLGR
jgi:hypothetical protein